MYYFIGIKGSGMASLAIMLKQLGNDVIGSDIDKHLFTEDLLIKNNIQILDFDKNNIKDNYTVIIGNAFLEDFDEVVVARNNPTCKCYRYHEFVGKLMEDYKTVSIAGSHGKTTTTTITKTVLSSFFNTGYLIGDGEGFLNTDTEYLCVESDEFRNHFHAYHPNYAIVTNIEIDHVDFFKDENEYFDSYQKFINNVKDAVFYYGDDSWCKKLEFLNVEHFSFGFEDNNDYCIKNLVEDVDHSTFDLYYHDALLHSFSLPFVGKHMIIDSVGVICLANYLKLDNKIVNESLNNYVGPKRRYVVEEYKGHIFVDDYAHHPTEVKVTLEATRKRFPNREVVAIFKPHRASRVLHFSNEFKDALSLADKVYLLDFSSIDDKQDGTDINIDYLAKMIDGSIILEETKKGAKELLNNDENCVYVFMSSKDIYNIANWLKEYI